MLSTVDGIRMQKKSQLNIKIHLNSLELLCTGFLISQHNYVIKNIRNSHEINTSPLWIKVMYYMVRESNNSICIDITRLHFFKNAYFVKFLFYSIITNQ